MIMKTSQPKYQFVVNLGDATPLEHGGDFLFVDTTGVYPPFLVHIEESHGKGKYRVSRIECPRLIYSATTGILSNNHYHSDKPVWFADKIASAASMNGSDEETLRGQLLAMCPMERARGYLALTGRFGWYEFDQYPDTMTRTEIRRVYRGAFRS